MPIEWKQIFPPPDNSIVGQTPHPGHWDYQTPPLRNPALPINYVSFSNNSTGVSYSAKDLVHG